MFVKSFYVPFVHCIDKDIYTYRATNGDLLEVDPENNETKVIMEAIVFVSTFR